MNEIDYMENRMGNRKTKVREVKEEIGIDLEEKDLQYMLTYQTGRKVKEHFYANHIFSLFFQMCYCIIKMNLTLIFKVRIIYI